MGIDASYIIPYQRGMLKKIYQAISKQQYYICVKNQEIKLDRFKSFDEEYDFNEGRSNRKDHEVDDYHLPESDDIYSEREALEKTSETYLYFRVTNTANKKSWLYKYSSIKYFPFLGLLEIDDGIRYYSHDSKHKKNVEYWSQFLDNDDNEYWSPTYKIHIVPDWCPEYSSSLGEIITGNDVLLEIPSQLLYPAERDRILAVFGPQDGNDGRYSAFDAINTGNVDALSQHLKDDTNLNINNLIASSVEAKSTNCFKILLDTYKPLLEKLPPLSVCIENKDLATLMVLVEYGAKPDEDDIYKAAKMQLKDMFLFLLRAWNKI